MQTELFSIEARQPKKKTWRQQVDDSRKAAFKTICDILDKGDVDSQFVGRSADYHSKEKFIVTWLGTWKSMPVEFSIDLCDSFYTAYSGAKAIQVRRNLFMEKQTRAFNSIELALLVVGFCLAPKKDKSAFYSKYIGAFLARNNQ